MLSWQRDGISFCVFGTRHEMIIRLVWVIWRPALWTIWHKCSKLDLIKTDRGGAG